MIDRMTEYEHGKGCVLRYSKPEEIVDAAKQLLAWVGAKRGRYSVVLHPKIARDVLPECGYIAFALDETSNLVGGAGLVDGMKLLIAKGALPADTGNKIIELAAEVVQ